MSDEGDAGVEGGRGDLLQPDLAVVEGPLAAAPDRRLDPEVDLVGESPGGELVADVALVPHALAGPPLKLVLTRL